MIMQEVTDFLKQNEEIGRNKSTTDVKIAMGMLKLKQEGFHEPGKDYRLLIRDFNGISNNGCVILGLNTESSLFPDIIDYNRLNNYDKETFVIIGYNDAFWLVYDPENKMYRIIDPDDGSEETSGTNLADFIPYILHI